MAKDISYSDGNIELYIEKLLREATDLSSATNIASDKYNNWPIRYHLSSVRRNSVCHLNFEGLNVLELGAGMGAISRFIAEKANHLTVVEGTQQRFNCLKLRLRDLKNWDGFVCNYQDFKTDIKYDVVCFFGVLEYAGRYIKNESPFVWAIKHAKEFLKPDGVLLIYIENKNGIKYFSGISEDHYGKSFYGLCGYSEIPDIKTFSKKEMTEILTGCGFASVETHHLAPDYKCTRALLTDEFVLKNPIIAAEIETNYFSEDYGLKSLRLFPERLAMNSLAKSGILEHFSNSYLFIASNSVLSTTKEKLLSRVINEGVQGFLYTYGRKNDVVTEIIHKNEEYYTTKRYLNSDNIKETSDIFSNCFSKEPLYKGESLSWLLLNYAYYGNEKAFLDLLDRFFEFVFEKFSVENSTVLQSIAIDAVAKNVKILNGEFINFDNEYCPNFEIRRNYFIFRTLVNIADYFIYLEHFQFNSLNDYYVELCKRYNDTPDLKSNIMQEIAFQYAVTGGGDQFEDYEKVFNKPLNKNQSKEICFLGIRIGSVTVQDSKYKIKIFGIKFTYKRKESIDD